MRPEPVERDLALREHGQTMRDYVIGEQPSVRVTARLAGLEAQHVGQYPLGIDHGSGLFSRVAFDVPLSG